MLLLPFKATTIISTNTGISFSRDVRTLPVTEPRVSRLVRSLPVVGLEMERKMAIFKHVALLSLLFFSVDERMKAMLYVEDDWAPPFVQPTLPLVTSVFFSAYDIDSQIANKTHYTHPIGRHLPNGGPTGAELVKEVCIRTCLLLVLIKQQETLSNRQSSYRSSDGSYWGSLTVTGIEYTNMHGATSTR